jgi:hypothetical protein
MKGFHCFIALSNVLALPNPSHEATPDNRADFEIPSSIDNMDFHDTPLRRQRLDFNDIMSEEVVDDFT